VARNESLFREVNERIRRVNEHLVDGEAADFICECGDDDCTQPVSLTLPEYEGVRRDGTHFVIVPDHVVLDVERVVARNDRFAVVEKTDPEAARIADARDPRA